MSFIKPCNHSYPVIFLCLKSQNKLNTSVSYAVCSSGLQTKYSKSLIIIIVLCVGTIINSRLVCIVEPYSYSGHVVVLSFALLSVLLCCNRLSYSYPH